MAAHRGDKGESPLSWLVRRQLSSNSVWVPTRLSCLAASHGHLTSSNCANGMLATLAHPHLSLPCHLQMLEAERKSIRTTIELQVGLLVAWLTVLPPVGCMLLYIPALGCLPQPHLPGHLRTLFYTAAGAGGQQRRADGHRGGGVQLGRL